MKKTITFLLFLLTISNYAQSNPEKEFGAWYMYNGSHKVADKFSLKTMAHFRFFEIGDDMQQFIGRLGGNYQFNKTVSATIGYAYLSTDRTFDVSKGDFSDHRIYEDLNVKHKLSDLSIAHRLRAEQRFFESRTGHFIRYQLGLSYPLSKKWSTYLYDEIFFDFDGQSYNQNWFGTGLKYKLSDVVKLQVGYMNISNDASRSFDRIQLGITISTDHRKKTK